MLITTVIRLHDGALLRDGHCVSLSNHHHAAVALCVGQKTGSITDFSAMMKCCPNVCRRLPVLTLHGVSSSDVSVCVDNLYRDEEMYYK